MTCNGTGIINITFNGIKEELDCFSCETTGEVSVEIREAQEFERNMWCKCGYTGNEVRWEDGEHPELHKHHYRCKRCNGVTQIG